MLLQTILVASLFAQDKMAWRSDYAKAQEEAKKESKYLVVHFGGSG